MRKFQLLVLAILFMGFANLGQAQKVKVESGDLTTLKGQTEFNLEFVYNGMTVGKYKTEEEYITKKKEEANKKEAGKGDKWEAGWKGDREARFEPKFIEIFNKTCKDVTVAKAKTSAKYTFVVKTIFTEPGFNIGLMKQPAYINVEITIVETGGKTEVAKITMTNVPGADAMGFDFDAGSRLSEAYAKCGKELAKLLMKKAFK